MRNQYSEIDKEYLGISFVVHKLLYRLVSVLTIRRTLESKNISVTYEKPLDEFKVRKDTGVRYSRCNDCVTILRHRYYEANKDHILAHHKEYLKEYLADPKNKEKSSTLRQKILRG